MKLLIATNDGALRILDRTLSVTNSRMALFEKHRDRLAYRMAAKIGPVPARVEMHNGGLSLRIMEARNVIGLAAKLFRYLDNRKQQITFGNDR